MIIWLYQQSRGRGRVGISLDWRREKIGAETFLSHTLGWRSRHLFCRGLGLRTEQPQCVCLPNHIIFSALPSLPRAAPPPLAKTTPWLLPPPRDIEMWLSWWGCSYVEVTIEPGLSAQRRKFLVGIVYVLVSQAIINPSTTKQVLYGVVEEIVLTTIFLYFIQNTKTIKPETNLRNIWVPYRLACIVEYANNGNNYHELSAK